MEVRRRKRHRVEREEAGEGPAERGEQRGCVGGDGQRGMSLRSGKRYCMSRDVGVACKHGHGTFMVDDELRSVEVEPWRDK